MLKGRLRIGAYPNLTPGPSGRRSPRGVGRPGARHVLLAIALGLAATSSYAATDPLSLSLEELARVQILATPKFSEDTAHSPTAVSILTASDIRRFGWRTLGDVLRTLPGFNVTQDHTYAYVGVRGISSPGDYRQRFQVLIDGMSVNDNIYASVPVDSAFPLDLDLVERIEVIRGPSASVYGGDSLFGVINVITRSGSALQGGEASAGVANGRHRQGRLTWGQETDGTAYLVSVSGAQADGRNLGFPDLSGAVDSTTAHHVGGETNLKMFAQARGQGWRTTLIHASRDRIVPTGSYATDFDDPSHRERDTYTLAEAAFEQTLDHKTTTHQRLYFGQYVYRGLFPYTYPPRILNRDDAHGYWYGFESRLVSQAMEGQRWTLGVEFRDNFRQFQVNADPGYGCYDVGPDHCLDRNNPSRLLNVYAQNEISMGPNTWLTAGLRFDTIFGQEHHWSPRIGLVHDADSMGHFKILYASAFRDPTVYERFYTSPTYSYGNPALRPEKMQSIEATWEGRVGSSALKASAYWFRIHDLIGTNADGIADNAHAISGRGLELQIDQRWGQSTLFRGGYALQFPQQHGGPTPNAPRHQVTANLALDLGNHIQAGLEGQFVSRRETTDRNSRVGPYAMVNLNLQYQPTSGGPRLSLGIYNLLDREHDDPVAADDTLAGPRSTAPQFGRTFLLTGTLPF
ncbi:MAG: TonB-dependent receptor [Zoogloeaceae bacterium]|nr:TonB-dependent receptor [Zoogloeaceae bacterium]